MKIIMADSDTEVVEKVRFTLNLWTPDWELVTAGSGEECVDILQNENHADAIVIGMQLRDMAGLDLICQIRDESDVPIIVISLDKNIETLVRAFENGASDYMVFPFNEKIFIAKLKALIRRREWDMQARKSRVRKIRGVA